MAQTRRYTSADLDMFPAIDGKRYEIIDGELYVSKQPSLEHQLTCTGVTLVLGPWCRTTGAGVVVGAPGLIFADDDDVAPDVVWVSTERLPALLGPDRKLHAAPELVVEVLSPGSANERRDRVTKLNLFSRRGVEEYWIVDWRRRQVAVYRREDGELQLAATLGEGDTLQSPLLPGFACPVREVFALLPPA